MFLTRSQAHSVACWAMSQPQPSISLEEPCQAFLREFLHQLLLFFLSPSYDDVDIKIIQALSAKPPSILSKSPDLSTPANKKRKQKAANGPRATKDASANVVSNHLPIEAMNNVPATPLRGLPFLCFSMLFFCC